MMEIKQVPLRVLDRDLPQSPKAFPGESTMFASNEFSTWYDASGNFL